MERPREHEHAALRERARYLVVIDSGGPTLARLFGENRELLAEFDAGAEEVASMTRGRVAAHGADGPEWARSLEGNSAAERKAAKIYTLDL
jgi:hypothetical protein